MSDAQASLVCAIASLWPEVPHQVCQIPALRDASKVIFEQDRKTKLAVRKKLQPKRRQYRSDLAKRKREPRLPLSGPNTRCSTAMQPVLRQHYISMV